ncbi:hypothetical protein BDR26DRAFT_915750 [Obelidium mucronatum]|nr:hypothetical protein BDR26DRAFT_915750 [Obelidium mucronatum]
MDTPTTDDDSSIQQKLVIAYASMAGITLLQWCFYFYFIIHHEIKGRTRKFAWTKVFTPLNIPLVLGTSALMGVYITRAVNLSYSLSVDWGVLFTLEELLQSSVIWSYIFYSWRRSGKLLRSVFSPIVYKSMYYMVSISPIVFYLPVVPALWRMIGPDPTQGQLASLEFSLYSNILMGSTCALLDLVFVVAFIKNLLLSFLQGDEVNREFLIVSVHGAVACLLCFLTVGVYAVSGVVESRGMKAVVVCASQGLFNLVSVALFSMKFSLYKQKVFEETIHDPVEQMMRSKSVKEDLGLTTAATDMPPPAIPSRRESNNQVVSMTVQETLKNFHPLRETNSTRVISTGGGGGGGVAGAPGARDSLCKTRESLKRDSSSGKSGKGSKEITKPGTRDSVHATRESLRKGLGYDRDSVLGSGAELKSLRSIQAMSLRSVHNSAKSGTTTPRDSLRKERREEAPGVPDIPKDLGARMSGVGELHITVSVAGSNLSRERSQRKGSPKPVRKEKEKDSSTSTVDIVTSIDPKHPEDIV